MQMIKQLNDKSLSAWLGKCWCCVNVVRVAELGDFLTFNSTSEMATMFASMKIRLRGKFFAVNLNPSLYGDVKSASAAVAPSLPCLL
jgi:hypothetical protein